MTLLKNRWLVGAALGAGALWGARAWLRSIRRIDLRGRVVLVNGASSGLGLLVAREAARRGAAVAIAARREDELEDAAEDLRREGAAEVHYVAADLSDESQANEVVRQVIERFGQIDVLINCAGIMIVGPVETMTREDFERAMATNFWGTVHPTLAALPSMKQRGGGRIANVISIGGKVPVPHMLPYTASKFALTGFSEGLRAELAKDNVLVTSVYPTTIRTGGHRHAWFKGDPQAEYSWFALSDTLPGLSASAHSAARAIVEGLCNGDPEVVFGWNAHLGIAAHNLAPGWMAEILGLVNRALPQPGPGARFAEPVQGRDIAGTVAELANRAIPEGTRPGTA